MLKTVKINVSSDPFPKPMTMSLADVTDVHQRKRRWSWAAEWSQDSLRNSEAAGRAAHLIEKPPPYPFPTPFLKMQRQSISGFVNGLRTYPIPPALLKACSG